MRRPLLVHDPPVRVEGGVGKRGLRRAESGSDAVGEVAAGVLRAEPHHAPAGERVGGRAGGAQGSVRHRRRVPLHPVHHGVVGPRHQKAHGRRRRQGGADDRSRRLERERRERQAPQTFQQDALPHPEGAGLDHGRVRRRPRQELPVVPVDRPPPVGVPPLRHALLLRLRGQPPQVLHEGRASPGDVHDPHLVRGEGPGVAHRVDLPRRPPDVQDGIPVLRILGRGGGRPPLPPRPRRRRPGDTDVRPEEAHEGERPRGGGVDPRVLPGWPVRHGPGGATAQRPQPHPAPEPAVAKHHLPPRHGHRGRIRRRRLPRRHHRRRHGTDRGQLRRVDTGRRGDKGRRGEGAGDRRGRARARNGGVRRGGGRVPVRGHRHGADGERVHGPRFDAGGEEVGARDRARVGARARGRRNGWGGRARLMVPSRKGDDLRGTFAREEPVGRSPETGDDCSTVPLDFTLLTVLSLKMGQRKGTEIMFSKAH
mmetsp:Transcript_46448/g.98511  ORF Transcript_46448/g.98511 Transcript_46448/m.98511 type:complete len:481 (-) Transcript_46448:319-1761(-)